MITQKERQQPPPTVRCLVCKRKDSSGKWKGETCDRPQCQYRAKEASKWSKGVVERVFAHYPPGYFDRKPPAKSPAPGLIAVMKGEQ